MSGPVRVERLRRSDAIVLGLFCLILFGYSLVGGRVLTGHESVIPQTAREMFANHDWLILRCGGYPWLERPPLPDWILVGIGALFGRLDRDWIARLGPVLMATFVVLLTSWMAAVWYGRNRGLLSGLILATSWEFFVFASDPEADIFLCAVVTAAVALFVYLEFVRGPSRVPESARFLGGRPWQVLAFFVVLGMTNLAKGLIFGTLMVLVPVGGFLLCNRDLRAIRRYLWLWGWLAFAVVWLAWPVAAYQRYPDVIDVWRSDYGGRWARSPFHEPWWYYGVSLLWMLMPWTVPALLGLWLSRGRAWGQRHGADRFLWAWAVLTPIVFSIPDGKHHHYMLQCLAPWAVLAALGAEAWWRHVLLWPGWLRSPFLSLLVVGLPGDLALAAFAHRVPGPRWLVTALLIAWPVFTFAVWWATTRRDGRLALASLFTLLGGSLLLTYAYQTRYLDSYRHDTAFLEQVRKTVPADRPLYLTFDSMYPLETFHLLFYTSDRTVLLHNLSFLLDDRIREKEVYVLSRLKDQAELAAYGSAEVVQQSERSRGQSGPGDRRTLFRLRFRDGLVRRPAAVHVSAMQAIHRVDGPFLKPDQAAASRDAETGTVAAVAGP